MFKSPSGCLDAIFLKRFPNACRNRVADLRNSEGSVTIKVSSPLGPVAHEAEVGVGCEEQKGACRAGGIRIRDLFLFASHFTSGDGDNWTRRKLHDPCQRASAAIVRSEYRMTCPLSFPEVMKKGFSADRECPKVDKLTDLGRSLPGFLAGRGRHVIEELRKPQGKSPQSTEWGLFS
jgi:hypothetical protein